MIFKIRDRDIGIWRRLGLKTHIVKVKQWPYRLEVRYVLQAEK